MKVDYFINNKERSHYCVSEKKALKRKQKWEYNKQT